MTRKKYPYQRPHTAITAGLVTQVLGFLAFQMQLIFQHNVQVPLLSMMMHLVNWIWVRDVTITLIFETWHSAFQYTSTEANMQ